jgi:uridine kinase
MRPGTKKDSFYKSIAPEVIELAFSNRYDFDHPDAMDMSMYASVSVFPLSVTSGLFEFEFRHIPSSYIFGCTPLLTDTPPFIGSCHSAWQT